MPLKRAFYTKVLTNLDVENVLTCTGYFRHRTRKRSLDELQTRHVSKLRYKAAKIVKVWCWMAAHDIRMYVENAPDLISKFSLKPAIISQTQTAEYDQVHIV
jgi:hypothetical protein